MFNLNPMDVNLSKFLRTQLDVEAIEIGREFSEEVFKIVFSEMKKLKSISLRGNHVPDCDDFYQKLPVNTVVRKLIVRGNFNNTATAKHMITRFPNLKTIKFINCDTNLSQQFMIFMSIHLSELEVLHLSKISNKAFQNAKFSALKHLHIEWAEEMSFQGWRNITKYNPGLEHVSMKWGTSLTDKILTQLFRNLKNLKQLKIGTGFKGTKKIFVNINKFCNNLKILEILKDNLHSQKIKEEDYSKLKIPGLQFYPYENLVEAFKEEENEWHDEFQVFENLDDSSDDFFDFDEYDSSEMDSDDMQGFNMGLINLMELLGGINDSDDDDRFGYYFGRDYQDEYDEYDFDMF